MKRKTLKKAIAKAPEDKKLDVAFFSKTLGPLEKSAREFLNLPIAIQALLDAGKRDSADYLRELVYQNILVGFCEALMKRDSHTLRKIADWLDNPVMEKADPVRTDVLHHKIMVGETSLPELARWMGYKGDLE